MHGLNFDETDSNYMLLNEIFKIIGSRESKQIMSRNGIKPLNKVISLVKLLFWQLILNVVFLLLLMS